MFESHESCTFRKNMRLLSGCTFCSFLFILSLLFRVSSKLLLYKDFQTADCCFLPSFSCYLFVFPLLLIWLLLPCICISHAMLLVERNLQCSSSITFIRNNIIFYNIYSQFMFLYLFRYITYFISYLFLFFCVY